MTDIADSLRSARSMIDTPEKWASQEHERFRDRRICIVDALYAAAARNSVAARVSLPEHLSTYQQMKALIGAEIAENHGPYLIPIPVWNDQPTTTHQDVMSVFDKAIAKAEEKVQ